MKLAADIKSYRLKAGMTQEDMAASIGLSRQAYTLLEAGKRNWKLRQVAKVYNALGYDLVAVPQVNYEAPPTDSELSFYATLRRMVAYITVQSPNSFNVLKRVMTELTHEERMALDNIVLDYCDAPRQRARMVAVCKALTS